MKYLRLSRTLSLLLCLCLLLGTVPAALAEDDPAPQEATVAILTENPTVLLGETLNLTAAVTPADVPVASWIWASEDVSVAEVTGGTGPGSESTVTITPLKPGQTKLTATANIEGSTSVYAECTLTVFPPAAKGITLDRTTLRVDVDSSDSLTITLDPTNADMTAVGCESSNTAVATVALDTATGTATVTGKAPGTVTITAKTGTLTATCEVTVPGVVLSSNSLTMLEGNTAALTAQSYGVASPSYEWSSSKPEVVRVIDGQVTAMSSGSATITVQLRDSNYSASCTVTVSPNTAGVITAAASAARPLSFSSLESQIDQRCWEVLGTRLSHVSGLTAPTSAGILLHKYVSADNPGAGVGSTELYWAYSNENGKLLSDVTFVPDGSWGGDTQISYTGYSADGRSFKGTIQVSVDKINDVVYTTGTKSPIAFSVGDFNTVCRGRTSRDLDAVSFTLPSSNRGTLYYNYSAGSSYNTPVDESVRYGRTSSPYLSNVSFVPTDGYTGTFTISYTAWDTSGYSYTGRVTITVSSISGGGGTGDVSYSVARDTNVTFRASDFNTVCRNATGYTLEYVRFTELPATRQGYLYYNYDYSGGYLDKVSTGTNFYYNSVPSLSRITFVPDSGFVGTVNLGFTGRNVDGERFSGTVSITVGSGSSYESEITYTTARNQAVEMNADDFANFCRDVTGRALDRVRFDLPASSRGTLYYDYTSNGNFSSYVSASTYYYRSSAPYLYWVSFVPASGFEGTVSIGFTGWDTSNERFTGTVTITVGSGSGSNSSRETDITYSTSRSQEVAMDADDFDRASRNATGRSLDRVQFELPASSRGDLYYNYSGGSYDSAVLANSSYYRTAYPSISKVTFVPASGYSGSVTFSYTGWDVNGTRFTGTVTINMGSSSSGGANVSFSVRSGRSVAMDADDFNTASRNATGQALSRVRFDLPSSSRGGLYYNYNSSTGNYDSRVSENTSYYRSSSPSLSNVSFVAASGDSGSVSFGYTGWDVNGARFTGTVTVTVETAFTNLTYSTVVGKPVTFNGDDYNLVSQSLTGSTLRYVRFDLPSSGQGELYYNYSSGSYDSRVSNSTNYYRSTNPSISNITFVPADRFEGEVSFGFTGWNTSGERFTGTVTVSVKPAPPAEAVRYTAGSEPVLFNSEDFYASCAQRGAGSFVSLTFTLPDASYGRLYYGYTGPSRYESVVKPTTVYLRGGVPDLSRVSFLPKAGYQGLVVIPYTGTDSGGETYSGTVEITVEPPAQSMHFSDLDKFSWAVPSIEFLYGYGVVSGTGQGRFAPLSLMTRGDFILMLYRAFRFSADGTDSFADVPPDSYYAEAIAAAKALGIAQGGADGRFRPSDPLSRQDAAVTLQRAMRAVGWTLNDGAMADLALYSDASSVSSYAVGAVSCMVRSGVLLGDGAGRINPFGNLTRGELAVMLHRALTL